MLVILIYRSFDIVIAGNNEYSLPLDVGYFGNLP